MTKITLYKTNAKSFLHHTKQMLTIDTENQETMRIDENEEQKTEVVVHIQEGGLTESSRAMESMVVKEVLSPPAEPFEEI